MAWVPAGTFKLQAVLSSFSADPRPEHAIYPHHPITCSTPFAYHEETGVLECDHAKTPPKDPRTRACVDHSVAILLLELAVARFR